MPSVLTPVKMAAKHATCIKMKGALFSNETPRDDGCVGGGIKRILRGGDATVLMAFSFPKQGSADPTVGGRQMQRRSHSCKIVLFQMGLFCNGHSFWESREGALRNFTPSCDNFQFFD